MDKTREGVISLYGVNYPLAQRPLVRRGITPFPQKVVTGDYRRSDHVVESEWVSSDFTGGLGVLFADPTRHLDRYWFGTLDGRYRYLTLPPLVESRGELPVVQRFFSFADRIYAIAAETLYRWDEERQSWDNLGSVSGAFSDVAIYDGKIVVLTTTGIAVYDTDHGSWTHVTGAGGFALGVWDDKLFRLDMQNRMWWTLDPEDSSSWQAAGRFPAPPGYTRQIIPYFDASGEIVLHAVARDGLYAYDFAAQRFYPTGLQYPETDLVGRAAVWRGELYVPVGLSIYKYNTNAVLVVGPDRDDGLPAHLSGRVQQVVAGHGLWFAVIAVAEKASGSPAPETGLPIETPLFPGVSVTGGVLMSPGTAFHLLTQRTGITEMGDVAALTGDGTYRLWGSDSSGVWSVDLPVGLHNPLQNPTQRYAPEGALITSWWDMGWSELDKLALGLVVDAVVPEGCEVSIYVGWDYGEEWDYVGSVTTTGKHRFRIGGIQGHRFRASRLLIAMRRGDDPSVAPLLRSCVLTYLRVPRLLWGWEVALQLTDPLCRETVGVPAHELIRRLEEATTSRVAGTFRYHDEERIVEKRVFITELVASEVQGPRREGRYTVSLIELES
jgi:hypothetical protein